MLTRSTSSEKAAPGEPPLALDMFLIVDSQDLIPDGVLYVGIVLTCTAAVEQDLQLVNSLQFTVLRMPLDAFTNFRHGPVCATDVYAAGAYSCTKCYVPDPPYCKGVCCSECPSIAPGSTWIYTGTWSPSDSGVVALVLANWVSTRTWLSLNNVHTQIQQQTQVLALSLSQCF